MITDRFIPVPYSTRKDAGNVTWVLISSRVMVHYEAWRNSAVLAVPLCRTNRLKNYFVIAVQSVITISSVTMFKC